MLIQQLCLENYRNIQQLSLSPGPGVNVIYGDNAQGKTNLVEALWLFTGAKSFRGVREKELMRFGSGRTEASVRFWCAGREQTASFTWTVEPGGSVRRELLLNEVPQDNASRLSGRFFAVVFSPAHLSLAKDGPELRRRFLDTALCQLIPKYEGSLREYRRILTQRNALLKDLSRYPQLQDTLEVWDEHLARAGAAVTCCRARYVVHAARLAGEVYAGMSGGKEAFSLRYTGFAGPEADQIPLEELRAQLLSQLRERRAQDIDHGMTMTGPHRDDLVLELDGAPVRLYGSQGQQRSCVLSLKMAECAMIEETVGEAPVILLDDVMSELDAARRDYLLNQIKGRQVFVTCCDRESFAGLEDGLCFPIEAGALLDPAKEE